METVKGLSIFYPFLVPRNMHQQMNINFRIHPEVVEELLNNNGVFTLPDGGIVKFDDIASLSKEEKRLVSVLVDYYKRKNGVLGLQYIFENGLVILPNKSALEN